MSEVSAQMLYECAPLEGVTDSLWRRIQQEHFTAPDCFYTPFIAPTQDHCLTNKHMRELDPEKNSGARLVPQLLGHNAEDLLWTIGELQAMGYDEVNLNLGCPSGTVVSKKKGAGLLGVPEQLDALLNELCSRSPLPVSLKTRIGLEDAGEFPALLEIYNRYPVCCLTVHPRVRTQQYRGLPDMDAWDYALRESRIPLCYNGNLFTRSDVSRFQAQYPQVQRLMLGRGAAANPKLFGELRGEKPLTVQEFRDYHDHLCREVKQKLLSDRSTLLRMKELWYFMGCCFENAKQPLKKLLKSQNLEDYTAAVNALFSCCPLRAEAGFTADL